jgi:hypothetical protein
MKHRFLLHTDIKCCIIGVETHNIPFEKEIQNLQSTGMVLTAFWDA